MGCGENNIAGALPNFIGFNFLAVAAAAAPQKVSSTVYTPNKRSYEQRTI